MLTRVVELNEKQARVQTSGLQQSTSEVSLETCPLGAADVRASRETNRTWHNEQAPPFVCVLRFASLLLLGHFCNTFPRLPKLPESGLPPRVSSRWFAEPW